MARFAISVTKLEFYLVFSKYLSKEIRISADFSAEMRIQTSPGVVYLYFAQRIISINVGFLPYMKMPIL